MTTKKLSKKLLGSTMLALLLAGLLMLGLGSAALAGPAALPQIQETYNFNTYLAPYNRDLLPGESVLVDVMLAGDINYTQFTADVIFDNNMLLYDGFTALNGWVASCALTPGKPNTIAIRSVPSMNMVLGTPCTTGVRIVTLKFTAKDGFAGHAVDTNLSFSSIAVSPPGGVIGATTAPGKAVSIKVQK